MTWRNESCAVLSIGSTTERAGSLAGLHRRRKITQSQHFTPAWVSRGIWEAFSGLIDALRPGERASVLDTSVGAGALFDACPLDRVSLYGIDPDGRCIDALGNDARRLEVPFQLRTGTLEDLCVSGFDVALINPPYSLRLDSPNLFPHPCTTFGRFGPHSAALSHEYALAQALDAARHVAALLPVSMEAHCRTYPSLRQIVRLPANTFHDEGARVSTAVFLFAPGPADPAVRRLRVTPTCPWPALVCEGRAPSHPPRPRFELRGLDERRDIITRPVTGNARVDLHHHNRTVVLGFHCGLVQARVQNALLIERAVGERLPSAIRYRGQGALMLDVMLLQERPEQQLQVLSERITVAGGQAVISSTLAGYYRKLVRRHRRAIVPLRRCVLAAPRAPLELEAKRRMPLDPSDLSGPSVARGERLPATREGGEYVLSAQGRTVRLRGDQIAHRYVIHGEGVSSDDGADTRWQVRHAGLSARFPELAHAHRARIIALGIDRWLAPFQLDSLIEGLIRPYGYIGAWEQGAGKARYAIALGLLHSGRCLIAVEPGLVREMVRELGEKLKLAPSLWAVCTGGDLPDRKLVIVSYSTLRAGTRTVSPIDARMRVLRTNAERWRGQVSTLVCDEGSLLSNPLSQQSRAVARLRARKLIITDGTPQRGYPRDLLQLVVACAGNARAHQPYGLRGRAYLHAGLLHDADQAQRGECVFAERHVVTKWVSREFDETLRSGAKREVPRIANLPQFREWLDPHLQRRLRSEPDLRIFSNCPPPIRTVHTIAWDPAHLRHYLTVAVEFAHWYRARCAEQGATLNLAIVLARLGAVVRAANVPHVAGKASMREHHPITSKQRFVIDTVRANVASGLKTIVFAENPPVIERLRGLLQEVGIDALPYTGQMNPRQRAEALDTRFRFGDTPVLLSTWCGQRGLNLEQAQAVILYQRNFSATVEEQAIYRTQRPTQTAQVRVDFPQLAGSIDEYMAQLVAWKRASSSAALDFGEQAGEDEEFEHADTIISRFCHTVLGESIHELVQRFSEKAA